MMSVSLKDAIKLNSGLQGQLQGSDTPNEAGIGGSFRSGWVPSSHLSGRAGECQLRRLPRLQLHRKQH